MAAVLRAVKAGGVADADIRTVGLDHPARAGQEEARPLPRRADDRRPRPRRRRRSRALIDAVAAAGADAIGDPEFGFADPSAGRTLATRAALADARRRADDAAAVAGLRITGVRSVNLDPALRRRLRASRARAAPAAAGATPPERADPGLARHARLRRAGAGDLHGRARRLNDPARRSARQEQERRGDRAPARLRALPAAGFSVSAPGVAPNGVKLLVVTPEPIDAAFLRETLGEEVKGAEVLVLSPATNQSKLAFWVSDPDDAIAEAERPPRPTRSSAWRRRASTPPARSASPTPRRPSTTRWPRSPPTAS